MILTRNGYYISSISATADQFQVELHVYTGIQTTDRPVTPTANIITSYIPPLDDPSGSGRVFVDISSYVSDEIELLLNSGDLATMTGDKGVWVDYRSRAITSGTPGTWSSYTQAAALPGYSRNTRITNLQPTTATNQASTVEPFLVYSNFWKNGVSTAPALSNYGVPVFYIPDGERLEIACNDYDSVNEGTFYNGTTHTTAVATPGGATNSTDIVQYVQEPVALDTIALYKFNGVSAYQLRYKVQRVDDPTGQASRITFVNSLGVMQHMWFFGRRTESFRTEGITSKRDTAYYTAYKYERHQYIDYDKQAREKIVLNSGWVVEANNEWFKELLMSEQIWWKNPDYQQGTRIPVRVTSSSMQMKTHKWDKLINYTIEFDIAADFTI